MRREYGGGVDKLAVEKCSGPPFRGAGQMESFKLIWHRFPSFVAAGTVFRGKGCIYLQTDATGNILRVGECDDPWERYKGGTAYALDAAGHGSRNLYFFAEVGAHSQARKALEANLIFQLQPQYNNQHRKRAPRVRLQCTHSGDVPNGLQRLPG